MITISVVIPTYNRRDHLLACLDSVAAQRRKPNEVIVVDDGSTDGTRDALAHRSDVELIVQENAGPGAARNCGARAASGDYLAFLDSDDLWFPWSLEAISALIQRHGNPTLLFVRFEDFSHHRPISAQEFPPEGRAFSDFLAAASFGTFAGAGMMVVRRTAFLAASGFTEDRLNAEDHDMALRLGIAPGFVATISPVIVAHRTHAGNAMRDMHATLSGLSRIVAAEKAGAYPGGEIRRGARRKVIARHVRPAVVAAIQAGIVDVAMTLYRDTFMWNALAGRGRYLAGVPLLALGASYGCLHHKLPQGDSDERQNH